MSKITAEHLSRTACVYVRQSSPDQLKYNKESRRLQYALRERAKELGWHDVTVIDEDLGRSASAQRVRALTGYWLESAEERSALYCRWRYLV